MQLYADNRNEYSKQFETLLCSPPYSFVEDIVYKFSVEKPVPRVLGESRILYIGRTGGTFKRRYYPSKAFEIELKYFDNFYFRIMQLYGPISIDIVKVEDTKRAEWEALEEYFNKHLEYPPLNRSIPRNRIGLVYRSFCKL